MTKFIAPRWWSKVGSWLELVSLSFAPSRAGEARYGRENHRVNDTGKIAATPRTEANLLDQAGLKMAKNNLHNFMLITFIHDRGTISTVGLFFKLGPTGLVVVKICSKRGRIHLHRPGRIFPPRKSLHGKRFEGGAGGFWSNLCSSTHKAF